MLEAIGVNTYYGDSHILQGVSLKVNKGQLVAILGRNGMGKTTFLRSVMGLTPAREGKIIFGDIDITHKQAYQIAQMGISLVPQGRRIFKSLTVDENLSIAAKGGKTKNNSFGLSEVYKLFPRLAERKRNRGNELSGGEQQMLAIGRALIGNPELLLLDEPSEGLAPLLIREMTRKIKELKSLGLSILLVEQDIGSALELADYTYIISKGKIVYDSVPAELRANEDIQTQYLGVGK
jgi:branched-chain amino acid transport system ATP-binding protein